jgi:hypothetical protein
MTGFEKKMVHIASDRAAHFKIEIDFLGTGEWKTYETLFTGAEGYARHIFPDGFAAHWVRVTPQTGCTASVEFFYS